MLFPYGYKIHQKSKMVQVNKKAMLFPYGYQIHQKSKMVEVKKQTLFRLCHFLTEIKFTARVKWFKKTDGDIKDIMFSLRKELVEIESLNAASYVPLQLYLPLKVLRSRKPNTFLSLKQSLSGNE